MVHTDILVKAYICSGGAGLACCFLMHHLGTEYPRTPITIEYSLGNPLAVAFFVSALVTASLMAWLFHRGNAKAEALLLASVAACIGVLIFTSPDSGAHLLALFAAVWCAALAPVIYVLKSEFSLGSIVLLAMPLSTTFVVAIASLLPNGAMGLGIAERLWYGVSFFVNATIIKMLYDDGRLEDNSNHSTQTR